MKLERRVLKLESRFVASPVTLHFVNGSLRAISGPRYFLAKLIAASYRGANRTALLAEQLELVRHAASADEPGGGHLIKLVQAMLAAAESTCSPAEYLRCDGCTVPIQTLQKQDPSKTCVSSSFSGLGTTVP
jgi:hypothetical protein